MRKYVKEKKIIVKSLGTIDILGGITGPILKPFVRDVKTIMHLVNTGKDVYEVLPDGTEIKLNISNYETDNNINMNRVVPESQIIKPKDSSVTPKSEPSVIVNETENKTVYEQNNKKKNK